MNNTPLNATLKALDAINRLDPNTELDHDGTPWPKELLYAERMSRELDQFAPQASTELQIAVRAQHIERWVIPRAEYPLGPQGYKRWRTALGQHHAQRTAQVMAQQGFSEASCTQVVNMLQKKRLKLDPATQTLEDVTCLVFIRYYLEPFAGKHSEEKLIRILAKTWNKMSPAGQAAARLIHLPPALQVLLGQALNP
jgi:hypothetical protein